MDKNDSWTKGIAEKYLKSEVPPVELGNKNKTVEQCEWCKGDVSQYFDVNWYDFIDGERGNVNYCPNCGRKIKED